MRLTLPFRRRRRLCRLRIGSGRADRHSPIQHLQSKLGGSAGIRRSRWEGLGRPHREDPAASARAAAVEVGPLRQNRLPRDGGAATESARASESPMGLVMRACGQGRIRTRRIPGVLISGPPRQPAFIARHRGNQADYSALWRLVFRHTAYHQYDSSIDLTQRHMMVLWHARSKPEPVKRNEIK